MANNQFQLLERFENDGTNGLFFNNIYIPEEIVQNILSYVPPKNLLHVRLVCKMWFNIIISENLWMHIYNRWYPGNSKRLPWYVFYCYFSTDNFVNMLKNGNGQEGTRHWEIIGNGENMLQIEDPPVGCDPLPQNISDFNGYTSCFVMSYTDCRKLQKISLKNKQLLRHIMYTFMPEVYVSEWVCGRDDCGFQYMLHVKGFWDNSTIFSQMKSIFLRQFVDKAWQKVEIVIKEHSRNLTEIIFEHMGRDTEYWAGHYGCKMAGGVVKIVFDSIQPL